MMRTRPVQASPTSAFGVPEPFAKYSEASRACRARQKFEQTDNCKPRLSSTTKRLQQRELDPSGGRIRRRPKGLPRRSCAAAKAGWSPERRARQAALIRTWSPWLNATGPKTAAGKARCAGNALKHGFRSRAAIDGLRRVRRALRLAAGNILLVRALIRARALPRIKCKPHSHAEAKRRRALLALYSCLRDRPFRAPPQERSMNATHPAHASGEDH